MSQATVTYMTSCVRLPLVEICREVVDRIRAAMPLATVLGTVGLATWRLIASIVWTHHHAMLLKRE